MAGKGDEAAGARGDGPVKRRSNGGMVRRVLEQRRDKAEAVKAGDSGAHGGRSIVLEPSVDDVRRRHENATRAAASQISKHV